MVSRVPMLIAGSANPALAEGIARQLGLCLASALVERFPDHELHVELQESPREREVFIIQPTSPPAHRPTSACSSCSPWRTRADALGPRE